MFGGAKPTKAPPVATGLNIVNCDQRYCSVETPNCSLYVNQTNLIMKSSTKLGGQAGGQGPPSPPLESPLFLVSKRPFWRNLLT